MSCQLPGMLMCFSGFCKLAFTDHSPQLPPLPLCISSLPHKDSIVGPLLIPAEPWAHHSVLISWPQVFGCLTSVLLTSADLDRLQPVEGGDSRSSFKCPEDYKPAGGRVFREMVGDHREEKGFGKRKKDC